MSGPHRRKSLGHKELRLRFAYFICSTPITQLCFTLAYTVYPEWVNSRQPSMPSTSVNRVGLDASPSHKSRPRTSTAKSNSLHAVSIAQQSQSKPMAGRDWLSRQTFLVYLQGESGVSILFSFVFVMRVLYRIPLESQPLFGEIYHSSENESETCSVPPTNAKFNPFSTQYPTNIETNCLDTSPFHDTHPNSGSTLISSPTTSATSDVNSNSESFGTTK